MQLVTGSLAVQDKVLHGFPRNCWPCTVGGEEHRPRKKWLQYTRVSFLYYYNGWKSWLICAEVPEHAGYANALAMGCKGVHRVRPCLQLCAGPLLIQAVNAAHGSIVCSHPISLRTAVIYTSKIVPANSEERSRRAWTKAQKASAFLYEGPVMVETATRVI